MVFCQSWNAFDGSNGNTHSLFDLLPKGNELQVPMHQPPSDVPLGMSKVPKVLLFSCFFNRLNSFSLLFLEL